MSSPSSSTEPDQSVVRLDRQGRHLRVHTVKVFVHDQDRSLRFFVDQLGFEVAFDAQLQRGDRWVAVSPPDGTAVLTLVAPPEDSKEYQLIGRSTGIVFVTDNVTEKYVEWQKRGVRFHYAPRLRRVRYERTAMTEPSKVPSKPDEAQASAWGGVFTRFSDVDGNSFELVGIDEVTREVEAQRRASAERLEAERRAAQELEIAREVQARFFPQAVPRIHNLDCAGLCLQARQVGGDYYDFLDLGPGRLGLVVGDISGKGIAAALLMANLQANLRSQCAIAGNNPRGLLESVNRMFYQNTNESAYATLFFAEYEESTRRLRYVNCGHLSALLLRRDHTVERLDSTCTVLGLFLDWECSMEERELLSGDTLILCTDGITESFNDKGEDFGEHRLIEALLRHRASSSQGLIESIVAEVREFSRGEQQDDITLIVAKSLV